MRILVLDIETTYLLAAVWGLWDRGGIPIERLFDYGGLLCFSAKWVGSKDTMFYRATTEGIDALHHLLDEADAVITFNGKKFDIPMINRQLIRAGYRPPSPFKQIDLIETVKRAFRFPSNKLQHVASELGIGSKVEHEGFKLWVGCVHDDEKAWKKMQKYNMQDVRLTEKLYHTLLPWIANHPNHNLYGDKGVCPTCGSHNIQKRGYYHTLTQTYSRIRCNKCGAWSRTRFTEIAREDAKQVIVGAALN